MFLSLTAPPELHAELRSVAAFLRDQGVDSHVEISAAGQESSPDLVRLRTGDEEGSPASDLVAVLRRETPRDVLVSRQRPPHSLTGLPPGASVGLRGDRQAGFLALHRGDVEAVELSSPMAGLEAGEVDAVVLGRVEARRSGVDPRTAVTLDPKSWLPAPGQGSVLLLGSTERPPPSAVDALDHFPSRQARACEMALKGALDASRLGGLGALALPFGRWLRLWAGVVSAGGHRLVRAELSGPDTDPEGLGRRMAQLLLDRGAGGDVGGRGTDAEVGTAPGTRR